MAKRYELRLGINTKNEMNGGLCYDEEASINESQSPFNGLINMSLENGGILCKRDGQGYLFKDNSFGVINGIYTGYKGYDFIHEGTSLRKGKLATVSTSADLPIIGTLANKRSKMFVFNDTLYILDGNEYYQYDGTTFKTVVGYYPITNMNRKPDGSNSVSLESWNMLTDGFRNTFNSDGTSKIYKLSLEDIDIKPITVKINETVQASNEYTVDYALGTVTFTTAPKVGDNNVEITAYRKFSMLRDNIVKCTLATEFSSRMFFSGNPNQPNTYYAGGICESSRADYFPQKYLYKIGTERAVTGLKVYNNRLIVFKEDMICGVDYAIGLNNTASFPIKYLHSDIGCDIPNSIQLINNALIFGNTNDGIFALTTTTIEDERAINVISSNVNGSKYKYGLLAEAELKKALSVVYKQKYILSVNGNAYVLDYSDDIHYKEAKKNRWFLWNNINANCYSILDGQLIYGGIGNGSIVAFSSQKRDFDSPIYAKYTSKLLDFEYPDFLKIVTNGWITFSTNAGSTNVNMLFINENGQKEIISPIEGLSKFSWSNLNWQKFSWAIKNFDKTIKKKIRAKKVAYFKIVIENNGVDEDLSIKNIVLEYRLLRKVR